MNPQSFNYLYNFKYLVFSGRNDSGPIDDRSNILLDPKVCFDLRLFGRMGNGHAPRVGAPLDRFKCLDRFVRGNAVPVSAPGLQLCVIVFLSSSSAMLKGKGTSTLELNTVFRRLVAVVSRQVSETS